MTCPSHDLLTRLLSEELTGSDLSTVQTHVDGCPRCQQSLETLTASIPQGAGSSWGSGQRRMDDGLTPRPEFLERLVGEGPSADAGHSSAVANASAQLATGPTDWPTVPGYEILGVLGRGGMGVVYRARDMRLNRLVALKVLAFHADADARLRFQREAQAAARLQHPQIVQIYEIGEAGDRPYLTLELVEGGSLADRLRGRPQPSRPAAELVMILARATHYAHQRGVIHRDLKPANILLVSDGGVSGESSIDRTSSTHYSPLTTHQPKIADFGLAKIQLEGAAAQTHSGSIFGTPSYMAPEQAEGCARLIGPATDVYALGAILYELLTGRPPFRADSALETLRQVLNDEVISPSRWQSGLPRDLQTICLKCLQKEPARRYASAAALADDLRRCLAGEAIQARPVTYMERLGRWCRRNPVVAGLSAIVTVLLVVVGLGLVVTALLRQERNEALAQQLRAERAEREIELRERLERARAIRRSGQRLKALAQIKAAVKLGPSTELRQELRNEAIACLALPDVEVAHEWDGYPDGSHAFDFDAALEHYTRSDLQGNVTVRRVRDDVKIADFPGAGMRVSSLLSPDGRFLAIVVIGGKTSPIKVWRLGGEEPAALFDELNNSSWFPAFSPDSRLVAFSLADGTISVRELDSGKPLRQLKTDPPGPHHTLRFHPRNALLACTRHSDSVARVYDLQTGKLQAELRHPGNTGSLAWHPDGRTLATECTDRKIYFWDVSTGRQTAILEGHNSFGIRFAFNRTGNLLASNDWHGVLRLWDARTGRQLLHTPSYMPSHHGWSSANPWLLAAEIRGTKMRLLRVTAGSEFRTFVHGAAPGKGTYGFAAVSADGRLLVTSTSSDGSRSEGLAFHDLLTGQELAILPLDNARPIGFEHSGALLTGNSAGVIRWRLKADAAGNRRDVGSPQILARIGGADHAVGANPDGSVIAIPQYYQGAVVLHRDHPGETLRLSPQDDVRHCAVSPDGRWVATGSHNSQSVFVKVWDARTGQHLKDLPVQGASGVSFSPAPDGRWLATTGGGVRLWAVGSWKEGPQIGGQECAFSPDGKLLAVEAGYGAVRLVDPDTGHEHARLEAPIQTRLHPQCFSPDGTRLVLIGPESRALHVWDLRSLRRQLAALGLDWKLPAYSPVEDAETHTPLHVTVDLGAASKSLTGEENARRNIERYRRALNANPKDASMCNSLAWAYVTAPEGLRVMQEMVACAEKAVALADHPSHRNTLGAAYYRAGRYQEALNTLRPNLAKHDDRALAYDLFFLAMSCHKLGQSDRGRDYYEWAVRWCRMQKNLPVHAIDELNTLRAEAEELFASGS